MDKKKVALLSFGHFSTDVNAGALPAILPFVRESLSLSYQATGGIMFSNAILSAATQPLFGLLADYFRKPWLIPLGIILAGTGISLAGLSSSYATILLAVALMGLGSSVFHPSAARLANKAGGDRKGLAVSIFSIGGNTGFVIGPPLAVLLVSNLGLNGTAVFGILAICTSATLIYFLRQGEAEVPRKARAAGGSGEGKNCWGQFGRISIVILTRSCVNTGIMTYLPLYLMQNFGQEKATAAMAVTVMGFFGVGSNILGGFLSDRLGYGRILRMAYTPLPLFLLTLGLCQSATLAWCLVPFFGYCSYFAFGPGVVLGQQFLARNIAFASGVTMGLSVAMGGVCSPILGWIGDNWGLDTTFLVMSCLAVLAAVCSWLVDPTVNAPGKSSKTPEKA